MKKIIKQYLRQVIILVILIVLVVILTNFFTGTSIKGNYDTVTVGITKGANAREIQKYLIESFKKELDCNKKIEVEAVGSFGTEFRIKSDSIISEERDFMDIVLKDKYEEAHLSGITNNPEANYRVDYIMYTIYFTIVLILGFGAVYFLNLITIKEEISVINIKKNKEELIEKENIKKDKEKRTKRKLEKQNIKEENKKEKLNKKNIKKENKSKDKKNKEKNKK